MPPLPMVNVEALLMVKVFPLAILLPVPLELILITPVVTLTDEIKFEVMVNVLAPLDQVTLPVVPDIVRELIV